MAKGHLPIKPGMHLAAKGFPKEKTRVQQLHVSGAKTLGDLISQYAFYTPAMLYMFVRLLGREPLWDFIQEYGKEVTPISIKFNKPIFAGLQVDGDETWNYVLYGMSHEDFKAFRSWVGTLIFADRDRGLAQRIRYQDIRVVDPLYLDKIVVLPPELPMIPVTVLAIDSNQGCAWLETGQPLIDLPTLRTTGRAFSRTKSFAEAVLGENEDPYRHVAEQETPGQAAALEDELYQRYLQAKQEGAKHPCDRS